eukprot:TRINITY_DN4714_c0_g1_i1.p1 TRINITY_DN4714_c0_g1~~TRINITY_DN4714_c0_g1_i1.p1  ORF type:complete len:201 (-),score=30.25 TRINITY_DN4714_c0_g1_i1:662-1264(-)
MSYDSDSDTRRRRRQPKTPSMIYTVPVPLEVFKFSSGQFTKMGSFRLGIADIEGSSAIYVPEVLEETIGAKFSWAIQEKNQILYGSFYDASRQHWSIKFDSPETTESFTVHVAIAIGQAMRDLHVQEISEGTGEAVQEGDTVGVKWLGFSVLGGTIDAKFSDESKMKRIVLGEGTLIEVKYIFVFRSSKTCLYILFRDQT